MPDALLEYSKLTVELLATIASSKYGNVNHHPNPSDNTKSLWWCCTAVVVAAIVNKRGQSDPLIGSRETDSIYSKTA